MNFKQIWCEIVGQTHLVQDKDQWWASNEASGSIKGGEFLN